MSRRKEELEKHDVSLIYLHDTERAILVTDGTRDSEGRQKKHWLPKSQVSTEEDLATMTPGKAYTFSIPLWLLTEKSLDLS